MKMLNLWSNKLHQGLNLLLTISICTCANVIKAQTYTSVGSGTDWYIGSLCFDSSSSSLFAGGAFFKAGGKKATCVAKWDGSNWDSLRSNLLGDVRCMELFNGELYIGGPFSIIDANSGQMGFGGFAKWDNSSVDWIRPDTLFTGTTYGLYTYINELYVLGQFDTIAGLYSPLIARFNGLNWFPYPPFDTNNTWWGSLHGAMFYNGNLYVGGNFGNLNPNSQLNDLAQFDGIQWKSVGGGLIGGSSGAGEFAIYQGKLIIGGFFNTAWGDPGNNIAGWDGQQWSQLGTGLSSTGGGVAAMEVYNGELWVGGAFTAAGGVPVTNIAKWDGAQWYNVGADFDAPVLSFETVGTDLYIAGGFWKLNGDSVHHIVRYNYPTGFHPLSAADDFLLSINPNPAIETLSIKLLQNYDHAFIEIFDIYGKLAQKFIMTKNEIILNINCLASGLYILKANINTWTATKRFLKQ